MDEWVQAGWRQYQQRLPRQLQLQVLEIPLARRPAGGPAATARNKEAERILQRLKPSDFVVALDERGKSWSSPGLAAEMRTWMQQHGEATLVIGGPDGISDDVRRRADVLWSLSTLTFPHGLVRVIVAEQLYRAWTILQGHPYHKGCQ
jgi:23S rRNA (pseudouridine1915-N3)-methyltransferase